jgi:hypothetical protein
LAFFSVSPESAADHLHALLALLLLLEELALAGDVTAVALREHVLPHGADGLAGDDPGADGFEAKCPDSLS